MQADELFATIAELIVRSEKPLVMDPLETRASLDSPPNFIPPWSLSRRVLARSQRVFKMSAKYLLDGQTGIAQSLFLNQQFHHTPMVIHFHKISLAFFNFDMLDWLCCTNKYFV